MYLEFNKPLICHKLFLKKISKSKDNMKTLLNLSYAYLASSRFKEGWEKYEYRWKVDPGISCMATKGEVFMGWRDQKEVLLWKNKGRR